MAELLPTLAATLAVALALWMGWRGERRDEIGDLRRKYDDLLRAHSMLAMHVAEEHVRNRKDHGLIWQALNYIDDPDGECSGKGAAADAAIGELVVERGKVVFVAGEPGRN